MTRRTCAALAAVGAGVLLTAGCGGQSGGTSGTSGKSTGEPIKIGSPLSLTGSQAHSGDLYRDGYKLCVQAINAHGGLKVGGVQRKLEIVRKDDDSVPATSAQLTQQLNDQGIKLFFGPYGSPITAAVEPVIERDGDVMVNDGGASNELTTHGYTHTFQVTTLATTYGTAAIDSGFDLVKPKAKTVAVLAGDDSFSQEVGRGSAAEAKKDGLSVVANLSFPADSTDLTSVLQKAWAKRPDIVVLAAHDEGAIAGVRAAHQMSMAPKFFVETVGPTEPAFTKTLGTLANGVAGTTLWVPEFPYTDKYFGSESNFVKKVQQEFGYTPDYHFAGAVGGCETLAAAIEKANSTDPGKVANAMRKINIETVAGKVKFTPTGRNVYQNIALLQIQHGKATTVWPTKFAAAKLVAWSP